MKINPIMTNVYKAHAFKRSKEDEEETTVNHFKTRLTKVEEKLDKILRQQETQKSLTYDCFKDLAGASFNSADNVDKIKNIYNVKSNTTNY